MKTILTFKNNKNNVKMHDKITKALTKINMKAENI